MISAKHALRSSALRDVVRALTADLEEIGLIDLNDLSKDGIEISKRQMKTMLQNIASHIDYGTLRGHVCIPDSVKAFFENKYFTYERNDASVSANDLHLKVDSFQRFKFYVSESNWIDLFFTKEDGSYATMVLVP